MNDLSGRIIRKSLNGSSESTLRRFIGNEEETGIYRVKKEGERRGRKNTNCLRGWPERIYALPRRYISRDIGIDLTWYYLLLNARVPHRFQFHDRPRSFAS